MPGGEGAPTPCPKAPFDLGKMNDLELAKLAVECENVWFERMARRVLEERCADQSYQGTECEKMLRETLIAASVPEARRVRALWALHAIFRLTNMVPLNTEGAGLLPISASTNEFSLRGWKIRLLADHAFLTDVSKTWGRMR